jgi:serine/threonine-protein kinase
VVTAPVRADYAGRVQGGGASVAISIHDGQAIAYVCNGSAIEAWYKGTAANGVLIMTGKNNAHLSAIYDFGKVTGDVLAHGTDYSFAVGVVHKPSGLYQATALVRGASVKAGWIVLSNGTKVGSIESDANSAAPSATQAPDLDVATGTAQDGDTVLHAVAISGATGSGF